MNLQTVKLTVEQQVAYLTLNQPPANTLGRLTIQELSECVEAIARDETVQAVVLTGEGKFFCAGADIKEFRQAFGDVQKGEEMARLGQAICDKIEQLRKPVIAAINGPCLGGGLELAMSCHIRLAAQEAKLGLPELKLGLIPGFGGTQRLTRLTNKAVALELILTSRSVSGDEAETLGIVNRSLPLKQLLSEAKRLARHVAEEKSAITVAKAMEAVNQAEDVSLEDGLKQEAKLFGDLFVTHDAEEGVNAFIEKRTPIFTDK